MRDALSFAVRSNVFIATWLGLLFLLFYTATARGTLSFGDDFSMLCVTRSIATRCLLHHTYPYDLAPNAYASPFLAHLQFGALIGVIVLSGGGIIVHIRWTEEDVSCNLESRASHD
jgi:hypothetical protein